MSSTTTTTITTPDTSSKTTTHDNSLSNQHAAFNFYSSPSAPNITDLAAIFSGRSAHLRTVTLPITDIRQHNLLSTLNLSRHGAQLLHSPSALLPPKSSSIPNFNDPTFVTTQYYPELTRALKSHLKCRSAVAINTTVRDVTPATMAREINHLNPRADKSQALGGFFVVHGDYSPAGGRAHLRNMVETFFEDNDGMEPTTTERERTEFLGLWREIQEGERVGIEREQGGNGTGEEEAWRWSGRNYKGPRWGIYSVWRPLEVVERDPLGVMDAAAFFGNDKGGSARDGGEEDDDDDDDRDNGKYTRFPRTYHSRPGFTPSYMSENILPAAPKQGMSEQECIDSGYRFFYVDRQTPEEVWVLKLFDSEAHTSRGREGGGW